jgi:predicted GIY-YIG superfamily endonuclease
MYFVYVLRTLSNTPYIGVTQALQQRVDAHNRGGGAGWTKVHLGAQIVYSESYPTLGLARKREIQLKRWSRAKKEALIAGDAVTLKNLSRCKSVPGIRVERKLSPPAREMKTDLSQEKVA